MQNVVKSTQMSDEEILDLANNPRLDPFCNQILAVFNNKPPGHFISFATLSQLLPNVETADLVLAALRLSENNTLTYSFRLLYKNDSISDHYNDPSDMPKNTNAIGIISGLMVNL
jgi:hypothetical protein